MANTPKSDDTPTAAELAKSAPHWRRRPAEFTVKAKATKDPVEKVLFQRSATSADALASWAMNC